MPHANGADDESRVDVALLLRAVPDRNWKSTLNYGASNLMQRSTRDGSVGLNADNIREAILGDMDTDLLSEMIGRELVSRLLRKMADHAGLSLELTFRSVEATDARPADERKQEGRRLDLRLAPTTDPT